MERSLLEEEQEERQRPRTTEPLHPSEVKVPIVLLNCSYLIFFFWKKDKQCKPQVMPKEREEGYLAPVTWCPGLHWLAVESWGLMLCHDLHLVVHDWCVEWFLSPVGEKSAEIYLYFLNIHGLFMSCVYVCVRDLRTVADSCFDLSCSSIDVLCSAAWFSPSWFLFSSSSFNNSTLDNARQLNQNTYMNC